MGILKEDILTVLMWHKAALHNSIVGSMLDFACCSQVMCAISKSPSH